MYHSNHQGINTSNSISNHYHENSHFSKSHDMSSESSDYDDTYDNGHYSSSNTINGGMSMSMGMNMNMNGSSNYHYNNYIYNNSTYSSLLQPLDYEGLPRLGRRRSSALLIPFPSVLETIKEDEEY